MDQTTSGFFLCCFEGHVTGLISLSLSFALSNMLRLWCYLYTSLEPENAWVPGPPSTRGTQGHTPRGQHPPTHLGGRWLQPRDPP